MTLERASELVAAMQEVDSDKAVELFAHFVDYFDLYDTTLVDFAVMSGFPIAENVELL